MEEKSDVVLVEKMDLTESIKTLEQLRQDACLKFYSIGKLLKQIKENETYKERYQTFEDFLTREGWSKEGYILISIVNTFPSIESRIGKRIGYFKLRVMLPVARHATETQRKQMLKMAEIRSCKALKEELEPLREKLHLPQINATLSFGVCDAELRNSIMEKLEKLMERHNLHGTKSEALDMLLSDLINSLDKDIVQNE